MKRLLVYTVFFIIWPLLIYALEAPAHKGYVSDYAGLLSQPEASRLEQKLKEYENQTTNQVVVLTVNSLAGEAIESFGIKVAAKWKAGQKGKDNGVIFIIAKADRRTRIEVGYGLEDKLTDLECALILENIVKPAFKQGEYFQGIDNAIDAIFKLISGDIETVFPATQDNKRSNLSSNEMDAVIGWIFLLGALGVVVLISWNRYGQWTSGRSGSCWSGTSYSGGSGDGGGFSGGGGGFGGGGASGKW